MKLEFDVEFECRDYLDGGLHQVIRNLLVAVEEWHSAEERAWRISR